MQSALHITTKVLPGNRLEVELPPGSEGKEVTVFVLLPIESVAASAQFADIAEMAADLDIQREVAAITAEFVIADMDGLEQQSPFSVFR